MAIAIQATEAFKNVLRCMLVPPLAFKNLRAIWNVAVERRRPLTD